MDGPSVFSPTINQNSDDIDSYQTRDDSPTEEFVSSRAKELRKLYGDGKSLLTNLDVQSALETRIRQSNAVLCAENRIDYVVASKTEAQKQYEKLMTKWSGISNETVPANVEQLLSLQKVECDSLLNVKDDLIAKLQKELERKRNDSTTVLEQMEKDIKPICQRSNQLLATMHESTREEIVNIRDFLEAIRLTMVDNLSENLVQKLETKEANDKRFDIFREKIFEKTRLLQRYFLVEKDKFTVLRAQLEKDVHDLKMQLKSTVGTHFLNLDKLKYGFYVLRQQIRENKLMTNEMKRSNIHLFDLLVRLRTQLRRVDVEGKKTQQKQIDHFNRTCDQLLSHIKRAKFLHNSQLKKFDLVFKDNEAKAAKLIDEVMELDKFITCDLLNCSWESPNIDFVQQKISPNETEESGKSTMSIKELVLTEDSASAHNDAENSSDDVFLLTKPVNVERLIYFVCSQLDFLIDKQTLQLSKSVFPSMRSFILTNSIFNAIGINSMMDLDIFMTYILKQANGSHGNEILQSKGVLIAFKEYLQNRQRKLELQNLNLNFKPTIDHREEPEFWQQYSHIFSSYKDQLWDSVNRVLEQHLLELENNRILSKKKESLNLQNHELTNLLA